MSVLCNWPVKISFKSERIQQKVFAGNYLLNIRTKAPTKPPLVLQNFWNKHVKLLLYTYLQHDTVCISIVLFMLLNLCAFFPHNIMFFNIFLI